MNKEAVILIPCYNPDEEIMDTFIKELGKKYQNIVFIDDGCSKEHEAYFKKLEKKYPVIKHYKNYGKGRGIKNGLNYILNNYPDCKSIITADCDGQHSIQDITKVYKETLENQNSLVLGTRNFDDENVPFKSRYGNKITRNVFKIFVGLSISDTQTGLRGMSRNVAEAMLSISGERYEYETNVLIACKTEDIPIVEVPIETIYIEENRTSHFNPIKDSIMIYKLFIKYIIVALSSFFIDILLFSLFLIAYDKIGVIYPIVVATLTARILSSIYNYFINAKLVFKKMNKLSIIKYFLLVFIQMWVSAFAVSGICKVIPANPVALKIVVDTFIFIINFIMQREFIFNKKEV